MKKNIRNYDWNDLKQEMIELGEKPFRAEQIFKWLYQEKAVTFQEMTNLSLDLRKKLEKHYDIRNFQIEHKLVSKDGTKKYLFNLCDDEKNLIPAARVSLWAFFLYVQILRHQG